MSSPLRIQLSIHHELSTGTGAPGSTLELARALRARGHQVSVVGFGILGRVADTPAAPLAFPLVTSAHTYRRQWRGELDVIDSSTGDLWPMPHAARAVVICRSHGLEPLVVAARRAAAQRGELTLRRRYDLYHGGWRLVEVRRSLRRADAVFVLSAAEARYVTEDLGRSPATVHMISSAIDDAFGGRTLPAPVAEPDIAIIGNADWRKGGDVAISTMTSIVAQHPGVRLRWLGCGPGLQRDQLPASLAERTTLVERFTPEELPSLLDGAEILLSCARAEGMPVSLLEAAALGLCAVASDIPGITDVLAASGGGLTFPVGDPEAAAEALRTVLGDAGLRSRLRTAAHHDAQSRTWGKVAERTELLYRRCLEAKR